MENRWEWGGVKNSYRESNSEAIVFIKWWMLAWPRVVAEKQIQNKI